MKKRIHYITYNDTYSGIYQSQVIDVVKHLNKNFEAKVCLVAFVPLRLWKEQRRIIKSKAPDSKVYPILGALNKTKRTSWLLSFVSGKQYAICRGPLAFIVAEHLYKSTFYDGRAAVEAEVKEYNVAGKTVYNQLFIDAENSAIRNADYFVSVSHKLVEYWEKKLGKKIPKERYSIIPCTLTSESQSSEVIPRSNNVKVVYAGGTGAWQSFEKVVGLLDELMEKQADVETLFLTKENPALTSLIEKYPSRCQRKWVKHNEVYKELASCDYGILLRDDKITNRVASPVKFAEYLNAGLKVLISPYIGDFSEFVKSNNCGLVVEGKLPKLIKVAQSDKQALKELCRQEFFKDSLLIEKEYIKLFEALKRT